jgi:hypothetical protein
MAGPDTVVQAALPLRLEFFVYGAAILMAEPETGAGQVEVEQAGAVAEGPARQNAPAQRAAGGEVDAGRRVLPATDAGPLNTPLQRPAYWPWRWWN